MPSQIDGEHAKISFGLGENVAASALVGIGFLTKADAIMHFSGNEPEIHVQALDISLPLTFEPPTVRTPPSRIDASHAYVTTKEDPMEVTMEYESSDENDENSAHNEERQE